MTRSTLYFALVCATIFLLLAQGDSEWIEVFGSVFILTELLIIILCLYTIFRWPPFLIGFGLIASLWIVEICMMLQGASYSPVPVWTYHGSRCNSLKPIGSRDFIPNALCYVTKSLDKDVIYYKIKQEYGGMGERICDEYSDTPNKHAIFFGCSYTFGEGVNAQETLPCRFARYNPEFRSYNFGTNGWNTGEMWNVLQQPQLESGVPERKGIAVYMFIGDHLYRNVGILSRLIRYQDERQTYRYYISPSSGKIERYIPGEHRWIGPLLWSINVFRSFRFVDRLIMRSFEYPMTSEDEAISIAVQLIIESKQLYEQKFNGKFYVGIWPRARLPAQIEVKLTEKLKDSGVPVLEFEPYVPTLEAPATIHPEDSHPSKYELDWIAEQISNRIEGVL